VGYNDLRGWLQEIEKMGELKHITGAHWDKELGAISEIMAEGNGPALLFDKMQGYPAGYRVLSNAFQRLARTRIGSGVPKELSKVEMVNAFRKRLKNIKRYHCRGKEWPIMQNVLTGKDIDLFKFPHRSGMKKMVEDI